MSLSETSIRRPVLAIVMSLIIVLFGVTGFYFLGVREYPAVDPPIVTVQTSYPGANPDVVASQITEPLEQVINGIAGIRTLASESRQERSTITVEFTLDSDLDTAANDVRDRVARAARSLPVDAESAGRGKGRRRFLADPFPLDGERQAQHPRSQRHRGPRRARAHGNDPRRVVGENLRRETLRHALVDGSGETRRPWPDSRPTCRRRWTPRTSISRAAGSKAPPTSCRCARSAGLSTPAEFDNLIIKQENGRQILFSDIGHAELGAENLRTGFKSDRLYRIGVAVIPQPNTNAIAIADEFHKRLEQVKKEVPPDVTVEVGYDFTRFVRRSVEEVEETLVIAFVLVALIIFLFLRDWRSTIIPVIAIPVSIVAGFFIMYVAGFSINVLTLGGHRPVHRSGL